MNLRQIGGCALLANALIGILLTVDQLVTGGDMPAPVTLVQLLAFILFIVGLPAIWVSQPQTGRPGQVGLALLGLGSAIAFLVVLLALISASVGPTLPFISALAGLLGSMLTGWLTVRAGVFSAWIGWLLFATGILNLVGGFIVSGSFATILGLLISIASASAIAGYGWLILQRAQVTYRLSMPA